MKNHYFYFLLLFAFTAKAQDKETIKWINANAIPIEDANPDHNLIAFAENVPQNFAAARIFGFGEASHHGKEFFDLKVKFFKYLVENQDVNLFIMEESYQTERLVNQWISGGEGDATTILNSFSQGIWYCQEVVELLQWMRNYNLGKPFDKQLRFYGMDNQIGLFINLRLRSYVKKHDIKIDENLLTVADSCSAAPLKAGGIKGWSDKQLPQLKKIKPLLVQDEARLLAADAFEYHDMLRALDHLEQYTLFIQDPKSEFRDRDMYSNVLAILQHEGINSKAFIWAHNEHVNKKDLYTSKAMSLGSRLKEQFKEDYYCMGFNFGKGVLKGYEFKKRLPSKVVLHTLDKPYKNTFEETLIEAQPDIYFMDMQKALAVDPSGFFNTKNRQLFLGGPGFNPKYPYFLKRIYTESYDGLIFVKTISPATY